MRRRPPYGPIDDGPPRRGAWLLASPFGIFGSSRRGGARYGARYGGGYGGGYRGRPGGGGGCLRDACLLETGCCLAEGLDGSCLLLAMLAVPQLLLALLHPSRRSGHQAQGMLLALVATYQREVSARRDRRVCRYTPTCSAYAAQAIQTHGAVRGTGLAAARLWRCRPGSLGGPDPVT